MASTFDALAWEIELAGARCIALDSLVGALMPTVPPEHREQLMESMQAVDLLAQHLTGLSTFARRMSLSVATDVSAPVEIALSEITLGALADRLSSALGGAERGVDDGQDAGDPDLF